MYLSAKQDFFFSPGIFVLICIHYWFEICSFVSVFLLLNCFHWYQVAEVWGDGHKVETESTNIRSVSCKYWEKKGKSIDLGKTHGQFVQVLAI